MNKRLCNTILFIYYLIAVFILNLTMRKSFINNYIRNTIIAFVILAIIFFILLIIFKIIDKKTIVKFATITEPTIEFEDLYSKLYVLYVKKLEKLKKQTIIFAIISIIFFVAFIFIPNAIIKIISFIIALSFVIVFVMYKNKYKTEYKNQIVHQFVKLFNNKLDYSSTTSDSLIKENFRRANFTIEPYNTFSSDDYIKGYLDENIFIRMADINVKRNVESGKSSYTVSIFQGIFAFTTSTKNINAYIKISKNDLNLLYDDKNSIEMDNSEFEKYFDVNSENKILTMRILTHDVMNTLVEFYKKYNLPFEIVLRDNIIYLRFFTGPMFEPKIFGKSLDKDLIFTHYCILNFIMDVSKNINKVLQEIEI